MKREDLGTAISGAGLVAVEVWLDSRKKWIFIDGQWDATSEEDGRPLNAVEFQNDIGRKIPGLEIRPSSDVDENTRLYRISPYLYYIDLDQQQSGRIRIVQKCVGGRQSTARSCGSQKKPTSQNSPAERPDRKLHLHLLSAGILPNA